MNSSAQQERRKDGGSSRLEGHPASSHGARMIPIISQAPGKQGSRCNNWDTRGMELILLPGVDLARALAANGYQTP